jgi:hypothetical protein
VRLISTLSAVLATLALTLVVACDAKSPEGDFGPAKPVKDDGTVRKIDAPPAAPDFANAVEVVPAFDKATSKVTVTLKIKPGFHAYAPGEPTGKPVELAVDAPWTVEGAPTIPAGTTKDLGELGKSVILEGDVPLTAVVKGSGTELKGTVSAQVCTDKACDRPKKHPFTVPTT